MKRRPLSPEDRDIWSRYARTADPLHPGVRQTAIPKSKPVEPPVAARQTSEIEPFALGERAKARGSTHALAPPIADQVKAAPLRMDAKAHRRMTSGKLRPEGKLDLHGMTLATAQPSLVRFILAAHGDGKRLVLVVTGKGKSKPSDTVMPNRLGVLKHQVPQWLRMAPLAPLVLQVTEAHRSHGGSGAYYIYLRRTR
ncbi:MAG: Smr/MutS family protein [Jannaschia sp.]